MSKKASTTAIGAFVVGAFVLVVAGLLIFGSGRFFKDTKKFVLFFKGSVQGLNKGAPVAFKGVRIGSVTDIKIFFDTRDMVLRIPVFIEIDPGRLTSMHKDRADQMPEEMKDHTILDYLVEKGLRATLDMQSLVTGQLFVNMDFYPKKPARYVNIETGYPEIPTVSSSLENISKTVEKLPIDEIATRIERTFEGIENWVNSPELKEIMASTNQTMKHVEDITQNVSDETKPLLTEFAKTLAEAHGLMRDLRAHLNPLATDAKEITKGTRELVKTANSHVAGLATSMEKTLEAVQVAFKKAEEVLGDLEGAVGEDSRLRFEASSALKELATAARSIRTLADYLDRHPEALLRGKGEDRGK
jgi:paraquat-inducible protein B